MSEQEHFGSPTRKGGNIRSSGGVMLIAEALESIKLSADDPDVELLREALDGYLEHVMGECDPLPYERIGRAYVLLSRLPEAPPF